MLIDETVQAINGFDSSGISAGELGQPLDIILIQPDLIS